MLSAFDYEQPRVILSIILYRKVFRQSYQPGSIGSQVPTNYPTLEQLTKLNKVFFIGKEFEILQMCFCRFQSLFKIQAESTWMLIVIQNQF